MPIQELPQDLEISAAVQHSICAINDAGGILPEESIRLLVRVDKGELTHREAAKILAEKYRVK